MKKRIVAIVLGIALTFSVTACSSELSNQYVTVKQYKGLEVAKVDKEEVTDEAVEAQIESALASTREEVEITDRASENGDMVRIECTGPAEKPEFDGLTANPMDVEIGGGGYIGANGDYKGFEEQLIGHKAGDEFDIAAKFPDEYQSEEWAGKVGNFHIKVTKVFYYIDNELTDDWVQANSTTSKTVKEYKAEVKDTLEKKAEDAWKTSLQPEILEALLAQIEVKELPQDKVDAKIKETKEQYQQAAAANDMEFAEFVQNYMGMTEEQFDEKNKEAAELFVKRDCALDLISEKKNLKPTEEEYEEKTKEYAISSGFVDETGNPVVDTFKEAYGEDMIKEAIEQEKVVNYLIDNCVQVESDNTENSAN